MRQRAQGYQLRKIGILADHAGGKLIGQPGNLAIIGLRVDGVEVDDIGTTSKTLPEFPQLWADMLTGQI